MHSKIVSVALSGNREKQNQDVGMPIFVRLGMHGLLVLNTDSGF